MSTFSNFRDSIIGAALNAATGQVSSQLPRPVASAAPVVVSVQSPGVSSSIPGPGLGAKLKAYMATTEGKIVIGAAVVVLSLGAVYLIRR